jgi:hypothetical protein
MASKYIPKNPNGRPEKPIDWIKFEKMCAILCTPDEIASIIGVSKPVLYERALKHYGEDFPTVYKRHTDGGRCSLRRHQFKQAEKSAAMAIWLGKQWLDQKETPQEYVVAEDTIKNFEGLMNKLGDIQEARKIDESSKTSA